MDVLQEETCDITITEIENAINIVTKHACENPQLGLELENGYYPLYLQLTKVNLVHCSAEASKILLTNSLLPPDPDICLIVADVPDIPKKEFERHIEFYETLLSDEDVTEITKIITFSQFVAICGHNDDKKKELADTYDFFFVDMKISSKILRKCGSVFKNKRPVPINLKALNLQMEFERLLHETTIEQTSNRRLLKVQIGHTGMCTFKLIENVCSVLKYINDQFDGRMDNIRVLHLYAHESFKPIMHFNMRTWSPPKDDFLPWLVMKGVQYLKI